VNPKQYQILREADRMTAYFPTMETRDIVSPSATILGFIITTFGILVAIARESEQVIIRNFALVFIFVLLLFVLAVVFTALSSLLGKIILWKCALLSYILGWIFLGTVMTITLIGYAYGIESLQWQLANFSPLLLNALSSIIDASALLIIYAILRRRRRRRAQAQ